MHTYECGAKTMVFMPLSAPSTFCPLRTTSTNTSEDWLEWPPRDGNGGVRAEAFQDLLLLRYCLCSVARALARELAIAQPASFSTHIRRTLFFAFSSWTEEGSVPGDCPSYDHSLSLLFHDFSRITTMQHTSM